MSLFPIGNYIGKDVACWRGITRDRRCYHTCRVTIWPLWPQAGRPDGIVSFSLIWEPVLIKHMVRSVGTSKSSCLSESTERSSIARNSFDNGYKEMFTSEDPFVIRIFATVDFDTRHSRTSWLTSILFNRLDKENRKYSWSSRQPRGRRYLLYRPRPNSTFAVSYRSGR